MLRLALIGCSEGPGYPHLFAQLRARFTTVVDQKPRTAQLYAEALEADTWSDSFDALLAERADAFDAVVIHSGNRYDAHLGRRAALAGKHVLIEGPLAYSTVAGAEVIAVCAQACVRLMVGQALRFLPSIRAIKASLDAGQLGEPGLLRIHRWEARAPRTEAISPLTREIDLACWLFGQRPREVYATICSEGIDYTQLHLGFAGGGMTIIDHAQTLPEGEGYDSLSLIGSKGAAYADDHHNRQLLFGQGRPAALLTGEGDGHVLAQLQEFIRAINENREPLITGADGWLALEVAEAVAVSIAHGQSLSWTGDGYAFVS